MTGKEDTKTESEATEIRCARCLRVHALFEAAGNLGLCSWCELPHAHPPAKLETVKKSK